MSNAAGWLLANQQMVAKSLQELSYEQVITPEEIAPNSYRLPLKSGVTYTFQGWRGVWTDIKVRRGSLLRNGKSIDNAGQFFIDSQLETGMDDIVLANFLEEMHNSLYADMVIQDKNARLRVEELAQWSGERVQSVLSGHPKILISKGRLGWSAIDQDLFGPEHEKPVQLVWIAAKIEKTILGISPSYSQESLLAESLSDHELSRFKNAVKNKFVHWDNFTFIPVHPWQWEKYIKIQFAADLNQGHLIHLGTFGDLYVPQISLRTFTNASRPEKMDIKLPITILNTSAIRGIPSKYIFQGPRLSEDLSQLCAKDAFLSQANTVVLEEKAGVACTHQLFEQIKTAPYRYHELLGAIWRQSCHFHLKNEEKAIIAGSLFHQDQEGRSLLGAYVKASGWTLKQWLKKYFEVVILPLYHLQLQYGVGLVAHGQNIVIRLTDNRPSGLFLKDFQGDLRMTSMSKALDHDLTRLPPHYLIHDLITGHFVTVLRYISETLQTCDGFSELDFYNLLGEVLTTYLERFPHFKEIPHFSGIDLLQPTFPRVLVNRVRFKIGYADSAERPLPILGDDLKNPIYLSLQRIEHSEANV